MPLPPRLSSAWTSIRQLRSRYLISDATERLIREADVAALKRAGQARIAIAAILFLAVLAVQLSDTITSPFAMKQVQAAQVALLVFGAVGWATTWLASRRIFVDKLPAFTAVLDALLILGTLAFNDVSLGIPGSLFPVYPVVWVMPVILAATAIHYQPRLQAFVGAIYVLGLSIIAFAGEQPGPEELSRHLSGMLGAFTWQTNMVRIVTVLTAALVLYLVVRQGRLMLERAVRETTLRLNLTRYLPRELAPILSERSFESLRTGRRIPVTLMFVDIRASSGFGETMDPTRLAVFITSFRRRVLQAAAQHGGLIDKFTGDGALILFGVPTEKPDDTSRALACGRTLLDLIDRWNAKRDFDPPVRIGIGIHRGEVFCGVVGDEDRLEFTVLGETVNTAARIEQATKSAGCDMLASWDAITAAGEDGLWEPVEHEPLRGVTRKIVLMRPQARSPQIAQSHGT
ncbi:MAG TPA: adenylate/guanylate cyclase domain-containing protein [Microvirga sp.]|nr:adenylate/guanylate cyclase domain-containing protein [Microvirga sp.]